MIEVCPADKMGKSISGGCAKAEAPDCGVLASSVLLGHYLHDAGQAGGLRRRDWTDRQGQKAEVSLPKQKSGPCPEGNGSPLKSCQHGLSHLFNG